MLSLTFLSIFKTGGALIGVKLTGRSLVVLVATGVLVCLWWLPCEPDTPTISCRSVLGHGGSLAEVIRQYLSGQYDALCFPSSAYCSILLAQFLLKGDPLPELSNIPRTVLQCIIPVEAKELHPLVYTG